MRQSGRKKYEQQYLFLGEGAAKMSEQELRQEVLAIAKLLRNKEVTDEEVLSRIKAISKILRAKLPSMDNLFQESIHENIFDTIEVLTKTGTGSHLKFDYNNALESFINLLYDSNKSEFENWDKFLSSIDAWKTNYLIDSNEFTLNGVSGWYWEFSHWKFVTCEETDYVPIILLICWLISFDNDDYFGYTMKMLAIEEFTIDSVSKLTKDSFLAELSNQYQKSLKRFEYYVKAKSANPNVIEKLTAEYPRFINYFNNLKSALQGCGVFRINELEKDENTWYFLKEDNYIHIILIQDFA